MTSTLCSSEQQAIADLGAAAPVDGRVPAATKKNGRVADFCYYLVSPLHWASYKNATRGFGRSAATGQ